MRRYYRFRPAPFYGGIATGDVTGCNLLCNFCWAGDNIREHPDTIGKMYSPQDAFTKLTGIARKKGFHLLRLSGQEPTVGWDHLLALLHLIEETDFKFILETNGILLGAHGDYAKDLRRFSRLHVRVSIKGTTKEGFSRLTGASPGGFDLQIKALENLVDAKVPCNPAVMPYLTHESEMKDLLGTLVRIHRDLIQSIEIEEMVLYPHVKRRLLGPEGPQIPPQNFK